MLLKNDVEAIIRTVYSKKNKNVYIPITKDEKKIQTKTSFKKPPLNQWGDSI